MSRKKKEVATERLDRLAQAVLASAAGNDQEAEAAAEAPFLYARLRARIAEEQGRRANGESWLSWLPVARRAVPAMALFALLAALLMAWFPQTSGPTVPVAFSDRALFDTRETGVEQMVVASNRNLSRDEVLTIVVQNPEP
jgi:hypothetical protein